MKIIEIIKKKMKKLYKQNIIISNIYVQNEDEEENYDKYKDEEYDYFGL